MSRSRALLLLAGALVVAAALSLPPIPDETYYWVWSRSLALSYLDHPPGVAWVLGASSELFGSRLFGLRIPALVAMLIVALASSAGARRLSVTSRDCGERSPDSGRHATARRQPASAATTTTEKKRAAWALLILLAAPMFAIGYLPATPDPFQGAATAIAAYLVIRALEDDASPWWSFLSAFALVASVIMKHSSAVIALGALFGAMLVPEGRRRLSTFHPWAGVVLGFLFLAPWLAADLERDGSIAFQLGRVLSRGEGRRLLALPVFAGALVVALGPSSGLGLPFVAARSISTKASPAASVLSAGALLLLAACLPAVFVGGGELNWPMPALVFALPAFAAVMAESTGIVARIARGAALASGAVMLILLLHVVHPFLPIKAKSDTTRRGAGFAELARTTLHAAETHQARAILTRRYQLASLLRYHTDDAIPVIEIGSPRRSQYDLWPKPPLCAGETVVMLMLGPALSEKSALGLEPIEGASTVEVKREVDGAVLETYFLMPVRATRDLFAPGGRCPRRGDVISGAAGRAGGGPT